MFTRHHPPTPNKKIKKLKLPSHRFSVFKKKMCLYMYNVEELQ